MEKDLEKSKEWALVRIGQFLAKLEYSQSPMEAEAYLYTIMRTAEMAHRTFNIKNHEALGCDRGLMNQPPVAETVKTLIGIIKGNDNSLWATAQIMKAEKLVDEIGGSN